MKIQAATWLRWLLAQRTAASFIRSGKAEDPYLLAERMFEQSRAQG